MFLPKHFEETDPKAIESIIRAHPLGTWICVVDGVPVANHIPFLFERLSDSRTLLTAHLAKPNPIWRNNWDTQECLVTFLGSHSYITPSWYPTKQDSGEVVPTWNYLAVHVYGTARIIQDTDWLKNHVERQTNLRESDQETPWAVSDAPDNYVEKMLRGIVGVEISISRVLAKRKFSQNKSEADQVGVARGLQRTNESNARDMAAWMLDRNALADGD